MKKNFSSESIKELRSKTGAGMMDCKKALEASQGHIDAAIEALRKKGLASAEKKTHRIAAEGLVNSYVHAGSRIGVLVELNCETDFVARQEEFSILAKDIAMQLAACQSVRYISKNDIPEHIITYETEIESEKEDLNEKNVQIREQIIKNRVQKRLKELSLFDQPFIKNPSITVQELVKRHIALLGENIKVRRFERFILGEGLEQKKANFAQEISKMIQNK